MRSNQNRNNKSACSRRLQQKKVFKAVGPEFDCRLSLHAPTVHPLVLHEDHSILLHRLDADETTDDEFGFLASNIAKFGLVVAFERVGTRDVRATFATLEDAHAARSSACEGTITSEERHGLSSFFYVGEPLKPIEATFTVRVLTPKSSSLLVVGQRWRVSDLMVVLRNRQRVHYGAKTPMNFILIGPDRRLLPPTAPLFGLLAREVTVSVSYLHWDPSYDAIAAELLLDDLARDSA